MAAEIMETTLVMHPSPQVISVIFVLVLVAVGSFVHALSPPTTTSVYATGKKPTTKAQQPSPAISNDLDKLPRPVAQMREAILDAVRRGRVKDLKYAIDLNELRPDFGEKKGVDPITHLIKSSSDGKGLSVLAAIGNLLAAPYAIVRAGADIENNRIYVWPYLAEMDLGKLKPHQMVDLYRLVPHEVAIKMIKGRKWTGQRLAIGADGVWHGFAQNH